MSEQATVEVAVGRELDAQVAERVMGFAVEWVGGDPKIRIDTAEWRGWNAMPCYSTSIGAAWEVVERVSRPEVAVLNLAGPFLPASREHMADGLPWGARFFGRHDSPDASFQGGETPAEAICRAALAWAGRKP